MSEPPHAEAHAPESSARRRRWPVVAGTVALVLVAAAVTAMTLVKVPYVIISPGDATRLDDDIVSISGVRTYRHDGALLYLTVRVNDGDPNVWRWLLAQLDDDVRVEKREEVIGCASYGDYNKVSDELMRQSQGAAKQVALRRLGYEVPAVGTRVMIHDVECSSPSEGRLRAGDEVTALDGIPVGTTAELGPLLQAKAPGDTVRVSVKRDGEPKDVTVQLGRRNGIAYLGIVSQTLFSWSFPVDVRIDTQRVSGPSAGLAFALAIVDDLTPGDLTGGRKVAVTGSIAGDGSVGVVGGVEQKAVAARDDGAALMLVPVGEAAAARDHAGDMKVVAVRTFDDALRALEAMGGRPVAESTTTTTAAAPTDGQ